MERYELEETLEQIILNSGVALDDVVETLELMLERYREERGQQTNG